MSAGWYKDAFGALHRQDWALLCQMLAQRPDGPLHGVLRAEYYLAPTSPRIDLDTLSQCWPITSICHRPSRSPRWP
jgi:hypothetical protein